MAGYVFTFQSAPDGPAQFDPNGRIEPQIDADAHNRQVEAAELAAWAERPDQFVAYYDVPYGRAEIAGTIARRYHRDFYPAFTNATITTWLGTSIGTITAVHVYSHNFGGRFVAITVRGTNGAIYHGRASWDNGSVIRLRRAKD